MFTARNDEFAVIAENGIYGNEIRIIFTQKNAHPFAIH